MSHRTKIGVIQPSGLDRPGSELTQKLGNFKRFHEEVQARVEAAPPLWCTGQRSRHHHAQPGCASGCLDSHRLFGWRPSRSTWSGDRTALARVATVFGATPPPRRPVCQAPGQSDEGSCARWHRHLAVRGSAAPGPIPLDQREPEHITTMTREQLDALVLGLHWQRLGSSGVITVV